MKKPIYFFLVIMLVVFTACKDKKTEESETQSATTDQAATETPAASNAQAGNEPKTYEVVFTPDSASLGKSKEAFIKLIDAKAVVLADPDGKDNGVELTFKIIVTNRQKIGASSLNVTYGDFRLELDNGNKIKNEGGYGSGSVDAESTKEADAVTYRIPTGAKPVKLSLFYDETRSSVGVELKEK